MTERTLEQYREAYAHVLANDPIVMAVDRAAKRDGLPESDALKIVVVHLSEQLLFRIAENQKLRAIAPRRIKMADGRIYRWDAPDEFVELTP